MLIVVVRKSYCDLFAIRLRRVACKLGARQPQRGEIGRTSDCSSRGSDRRSRYRLVHHVSGTSQRKPCHAESTLADTNPELVAKPRDEMKLARGDVRSEDRYLLAATIPAVIACGWKCGRALQFSYHHRSGVFFDFHFDCFVMHWSLLLVRETRPLFFKKPWLAAYLGGVDIQQLFFVCGSAIHCCAGKRVDTHFLKHACLSPVRVLVFGPWRKVPLELLRVPVALHRLTVRYEWVGTDRAYFGRHYWP